MKLYLENYIDESSTSRLVRRFKDDSCFAIISAYTGVDRSENLHNQARLKNQVKNKYGFNEFESFWKDEEGNEFSERALLIPNISFNDAFKLAVDYDQYSFIYKDKDSCREIASKDTEKYSKLDVIRQFNTSNDNFMNIEFAKSVFTRSKEGAASKLIKSGNAQPFSLKEVLQPRPSYFQDGYRYINIDLE